MEKNEPDTQFLTEELSLAEQHLRPPEYEQIREILLENAKMTDVKRAAAFFKLIRYSYGSGCTSFGCQPFDVRKYFDVIWKASNRLAETVIENKDFEALIRQYDRDNAFFIVIHLIMKRKDIMRLHFIKKIIQDFGMF